MYSNSIFNTYTNPVRDEITAMKQHHATIEYNREHMAISKAPCIEHSCAHCRYYQDNMPHISRYAFGKCRKTDLQLDPFIYPPTAMCCIYYKHHKRKRRLK